MPAGMALAERADAATAPRGARGDAPVPFPWAVASSSGAATPSPVGLSEAPVASGDPESGGSAARLVVGDPGSASVPVVDVGGPGTEEDVDVPGLVELVVEVADPGTVEDVDESGLVELVVEVDDAGSVLDVDEVTVVVVVEESGLVVVVVVVVGDAGRETTISTASTNKEPAPGAPLPRKRTRVSAPRYASMSKVIVEAFWEPERAMVAKVVQLDPPLPEIERTTLPSTWPEVLRR